MPEDNVIFLAHRNDNAPTNGEVEVSSCRACKNKTFLLIHDQSSPFPRVQCAACGGTIGRIGWYNEANE